MAADPSMGGGSVSGRHGGIGGGAGAPGAGSRTNASQV